MSNLRPTRFLSVVFVFLMMSPCFVVAVNNHGLSWGVEEGDRIDYTKTTYSSLTGTTTTHDFYIIVNELSAIPENVTDIWSITLLSFMSLNLTPYYTNGTLARDDISGHGYVSGYPIGNWSFIQDFISQNGNDADVEWINTDTEWGYTRHSTNDIFSYSSESTITYLYSKIDGLINKWSYKDERIEEDGSSYFFQFILTRKGYGLEYLPVILIGGGISMVAIIALYVKKKR